MSIFKKTCSSLVATSLLLTTFAPTAVAASELSKVGQTINIESNDQPNLKSVYTDGPHTYYILGNGELYQYEGPGGDITLPAATKSIAEMAFYRKSITGVTIPEGVTHIGKNAFMNNQIQTISLPTTLRIIDEYAFYENQLKTLELPNGLEIIEQYAFSQNDLTNAILPDSLQKIGDQAFAYNQLSTITIPSGIKDIAGHVFMVNKLTEINLPEGVETIGSGAFGYNSISKISLPTTLKSIGGNAFVKNNLTTIELPENLESIGASAFRSNSLENIKITSEIPPVFGQYWLQYQTTDSVTITHQDNSQWRALTDAQLSATSGINIIRIYVMGKFPIIDSKDLLFKARKASEQDLLIGVNATDFEDGELPVKVKSHTVDFNKVGVYEVEYEATDSDGNTTLQKQTVTIASNEMPQITSTPLLFKARKAGEQDLLISANATDFEDGELPVKVKSHTVDFNKVGIYEVEYEVTDSDGNTTLQKQTVTITSNEMPQIFAKDLDFDINSGNEQDLLIGVTATDFEDGELPVKVKSHTVDFNMMGTYEVEYEATDNDGNTTIQNRIVTITNNGKPIIYAQDLLFKANVATESDLLTDVKAIDFEDGELPVKVKSHTVDFNKVGVYEVEYEATDSNGNTVTELRNVIVQSNEKPILRGISALIIKAGDTFDVLSGVTATDVEDGDLTANIEVTGAVDVNVVGTYELTYTVTDSDGNIVTAERVITVRSNEKPIFDGVKASTVKVGDTFDVLSGVTATDEEDGDLTANIEVTGAVDVNVVGTYELIYTVTDSDGNIVTAKRVVTVRSNEKPVFIGVNTTTIKVGDMFDALAGVVATDEEDGDLTQDTTVIGTVNTNQTGTYVLVYTVTDSDENTIATTRIVTVRSNEKPVFNGVEDMTIKKGDRFNAFDGVTVTDEEDGNMIQNLQINGQVDTNKEGTYELAYTVTDSDGNTATAIRIITVRSNEKPVISGINSVTITQNQTFNPLDGITAEDEEDGAVVVTIIGEVDTANVGTYVLVYTATDSDGNMTAETRIVNVVQGSNPIITGVDDLTIPVGVEFNPLEGVNAIDHEGGDLTHAIEVSGIVNRYQLGSYPVTYIVTDSEGNTTSVERMVTVDYVTPTDWQNNWASPYIRGAMEKGWVTTTDTFRPNDNITRAEFVKIVNNAFGYTELAESEPFGDVKEAHWFYQEILIAVKAGYISTSSNYFRPNETITREEVAAIITNIKGNKDTDFDKIQQYSDYNEISSWARDSVEGVVEAGYMGKGSDKFRPKSPINRAEAVVTLGRVFE